MDPFAPRTPHRRRGASRGQSGDGGETSRKSRTWILLGLVMVVLAVWGFMVAALGDGEQAGSPGRNGGGSPNQAAEDSGEERGGKERGEGAGGKDLPLTAPGDKDRGEPNPDAPPSDHEDIFVTEPEGSDAGPEPGGAKGEPGGYDPLDKGTDGPVLAETQIQRAELAAANYVTAVYGYSGSDTDEYQRKVGEAVVFPGFFSSPGAENVRDIQQRIAESPSGVTSGATLTGFEIQEQTEKQIKGVAYFEVGDRLAFDKGDPDGVSLQGDVTRYAQPLNLELYGPQWRVTAAGQRQEVS